MLRINIAKANWIHYIPEKCQTALTGLHMLRSVTTVVQIDPSDHLNIYKSVYCSSQKQLIVYIFGKSSNGL